MLVSISFYICRICYINNKADSLQLLHGFFSVAVGRSDDQIGLKRNNLLDGRIDGIRRFAVFSLPGSSSQRLVTPTILSPRSGRKEFPLFREPEKRSAGECSLKVSLRPISSCTSPAKDKEKQEEEAINKVEKSIISDFLSWSEGLLQGVFPDKRENHSISL